MRSPSESVTPDSSSARDAGAEPRFHAELAQGLLDDRTGAFAHIGCDRLVAVDDDDARLGILAEDFAQSRGHLGGRLDAGETAAGHDDRVAPVHRRPFRQAVQMLVEGDRIIE